MEMKKKFIIIKTINSDNNNDNIIIENSTFAKNQTISVYNIQGNMLLQQAIWQTKTEIDISTLAKGIYFVNLKTKEEGITKKFIKN